MTNPPTGALAYDFPPEAFDPSTLPDVDVDFLDEKDLQAFERALQAPDPLQSPVDDGSGVKPGARTSSPWHTKRNSQVDFGSEDGVAAPPQASGRRGSATPTFITAQNDWAPVNSPVYHRHKRGTKRRRKGKATGAVDSLLGTRSKDETREGHLYELSKWPLLALVFAWLGGLGLAYLWTRWYIWVYEHFFTWRGQRQQLRSNMRRTYNYGDWVSAARAMDMYLGRQAWREEDGYAYYDSRTVKRVWDQMRKTRLRAEAHEHGEGPNNGGEAAAVNELRGLIEACVKNNFAGIENARLYSQTYYGTKNLVQNFIDEGRFTPPPLLCESSASDLTLNS